MNAAKQFEKKFELVPTDDPALVGFKVALNNEFFSPSDVPTFATAYSAWTYRNPLRSAWDAYVYVKSEEDKGETWFHFIPSLPSSVAVSQRNDPIWGMVTVYEYLQNTLTTSLPEIASATGAYAPINTAGFVLDAKEQTLARGLSKFTIDVVAPYDNASLPFKRFDEESGSIVEGNKKYTLSASQPTASGPDSAGLYNTLEKVSNNQWLQVYDYVTGLPTSYATALEWDSQDKIYWPPVLVDYVFKVVVNAEATAWNKLLHTNIREGFSGEVNVQRKLWWQLTPYTIPTAESMVAARMDVDGNLESISVRETLHGTFSYSEENYISQLAASPNNLDHRIVTWTFQPTNYTDWPATITKVTQDFHKGGYKCLEEIYSRPDNYNASTSTLSERNWMPSDGVFYG